MQRWMAGLVFLMWILACNFLYADTPSVTSVPPVAQTMNGANIAPGSQAAENSEVMTDIVDIKANEAIGFDARIVYIVLAVIGALVLIALIFFLIDRYIKKRRKPDAKVEVRIPADERALKDLESLEAKGFDDARVFYFTLTAIIKTYLDDRFGIGAPEMTTEELIPIINTISLDKILARDVKELLKRSDPVKFAGLGENRDQMVCDISFVKTFVAQTTPDDQKINE